MKRELREVVMLFLGALAFHWGGWPLVTLGALSYVVGVLMRLEVTKS